MKNGHERTKTETMYLDKGFWDIISCLDERLKIIGYLINHRAGKYSIGTIKQISENTQLSVGRVQKFLKSMEEKEIVKREGNGVYILCQALLPIQEQSKQ